MAEIEVGPLSDRLTDDEIAELHKQLDKQGVSHLPNEDGDHSADLSDSIDDDSLSEFFTRLEARDAAAEIYVPVEFDGTFETGGLQVASLPVLLDVLGELRDELDLEDEEDEDEDEDGRRSRRRSGAARRAAAPSVEADEQERAGRQRQEAAPARQVLTPISPLLQLDQEQREAARIDGAACVVAGAGSGKTRTLLGRVQHLLSAGVAPSEIALCTFTHRAAQEMTGRLPSALPFAGTLHQLMYRLLARHGERIGLPRFTVASAADSAQLLARCLSASR